MSYRCNRQPKQFLRFIRPQILTTRKDKLFPKLTSDVKVGYDQLNFNTAQLKGLDGRLRILSNHITDLIKFERIELALHKAEEIRPYTERLIIEAIRNGDCHVATMELADFWIRVISRLFLFNFILKLNKLQKTLFLPNQEKQLIHKLFKVLVPRYMEYTTSFTKLYRLGIYHQNSYKPSEFKMNNCPTLGVLELKGNPLPPVVDFSKRYKNNRNNLTNILLREARNEYNATHSTTSEQHESQLIVQ